MTVAIWERRYRNGVPRDVWNQYKTGLSPEEAASIVDLKAEMRKKAGIDAEFVVIPEDETPLINVKG